MNKNNLDKIIPVRFRQSEYEFLKLQSTLADESGRKYKSFSEFVRETLLANHQYNTPFVKMQLADLRYEIHKIGVNINQATKKMNSGYGSQRDVEILKCSLKSIEEILTEYIEKVERNGDNKTHAHEGSFK